MGLFSEVYCADCGKKTNPIARTSLNDGTCLCLRCTMRVPPVMQGSLTTLYSLTEYREFKDYMRTTNRELRKKFRETISYRTLHLDEVMLYHFS